MTHGWGTERDASIDPVIECTSFDGYNDRLASTRSFRRPATQRKRTLELGSIDRVGTVVVVRVDSTHILLFMNRWNQDSYV